MSKKIFWLHLDPAAAGESMARGPVCDMILSPEIISGKRLSQLAADCGQIVFSQTAENIGRASEKRRPVHVSDHVNLSGFNPLRGPNPDELGPRFPDMSRAYASDAECRLPGMDNKESAVIYAGSSEFGLRADLLVWQSILAGHQGIRPLGMIPENAEWVRRTIQMINEEKDNAS